MILFFIFIQIIISYLFEIWNFINNLNIDLNIDFFNYCFTKEEFQDIKTLTDIQKQENEYNNLNNKKKLKILINNYILEDYINFNNMINSNIYNFRTLSDIFISLMISIETYIITIQKIYYECIYYFSELLNWYGDYKILLDKSIVSSNFVNDLYYNISLELLLDIQNEQFNSLLFLLTENNKNDTYNIKSDLYLILFKNYSQILQENPYKVAIELLHLYKQYPRSIILSYGLDYDINVIQHNKYLFSLFENEVSNISKLKNINIDYTLFNWNNDKNYQIVSHRIIDKAQKNYSNMMTWVTNIGTNILKYQDYNYIIYNNETEIFHKMHTLFLKRINESAKWFNKIFFWTRWPIDKFMPTVYYQNWRGKILETGIIEDASSRLKRYFGGYSYWWAWHQDATSIHGKYGSKGKPIWHDYIKWNFMAKKNKYFFTVRFRPEYIHKIKHTGVIMTQYYPGKINAKYKDFNFDFDFYKKRPFLRYIFHGRRAWNMEKLHFKNFLFSYDIYASKFYSIPKYTSYYADTLEYKKDLYNFDFSKLKSRNKFEKKIYLKFRINSPEIFPKIRKRKLIKFKTLKLKSVFTKYWFSFVSEDDLITKRFTLQKKTLYKIFKVLIKYYNKSINFHYRTFKGMRGFLTKQYALDFMMRPDSLLTSKYVKNTNVTWQTFYTHIESVTEPLNLNYIHKNFYGRHVYKESDNFLEDRRFVYTDKELPKTTKLLLKKSYIENLIYVYQREEEPMINYIKHKLDYFYLTLFFYNYYEYKEYFVILWDRIIESYKLVGGEIYKDLIKQLPKIKQWGYLKEQYHIYKVYLKYFWVLIFILFYCFMASFLVVVIKSFLPRNLTYGIKVYEYSNWLLGIKNLLEAINKKPKIDTTPLGYIDDIKYHYNKMAKKMELIKFDNSFFSEDQLYKKFYKESEYLKRFGKIIDYNKNQEFTWEEFNLKLRKANQEEKMYIKKNFFDAEQRFIYAWEKRHDKVFSEDIDLQSKRSVPFSRVKTYNKIDSKKIKDLAKNYNIFYKTFISEKNLEKWENNTKLRAHILLWAKYLGTSAYGLIKGLLLYYRDRRFNHNRVIFWEDPLLEKESKVIYYFAIPKYFFPIFFAFRFIIGAIQLWDYKYWVKRWKQFVAYGIHARIDYKDLRNHLNKDWTLEWYKDLADYGTAMFYKDYTQVVKKFNNIKKTPADREAIANQQRRLTIINNILKLTFDSEKYTLMTDYIKSMQKIEEDRFINNFDLKFQNIRKKLILDVDKITPKQWVEQRIMHDFINIVMEKKLAVELDEYHELKQSYSKRVSRDWDDDEKTLIILEWDYEKNIKIIMDKKIASVHYEKQMREFNFKNNIIDSGLDIKDKIFYDSIEEYKTALKEAYEKLDEEALEQKVNNTVYEIKSRKLYEILETNYLWYRWYTTMGSRLNFLLSQIYGIFVGWTENIQKIRKNEYSMESLILIIFTDFSEFIYKMYWEYLVIWKRYGALKRLGLSLIEILKFGIILVPILLYTGSLYILLFIYLFLKIISNKIYTNSKINKFWQYIQRPFVIISNDILLIFNILFRDLKTGYSIFDILYIKFYNICAWIQRNIYFIKGAFKLGYKEKEGGIILGLKKVLYYFKLKYKAYIEQLILKKRNKKTIVQEIKDFYKLTKNSIFIKIELIITFLNIKNIFIEMHWNIIRFIYISIGYPIFKMDSKVFYTIYAENIKLFKHYFVLYLDSIYTLFNLIRKINFYDFIVLVLKRVFVILTLPIRFVINHQRWKYINNYKKGIQGFRDNPMSKIINNPIHVVDWRIKLHNILMTKVISKKLRELKMHRETLLEIFLMYKVEEVRWANKNTFQEHFWKSWYWYVKTTKEKILTYLIDLFINIENGYQSFESAIETKNFSFFERLKYSYHIVKLDLDFNDREEQKRISRELFFHNKAIERRRLMRRYFLKGLLNWLTYITINKIIFTSLENSKLRSRHIKYKHIKYKVPPLNKTVHLTEYLTKVPPQLWSLVILYDIYFKYVLRYHYRNYEYPLNWSEGLEHQRMYKWRLATPTHTYDFAFIQRRRLGADLNAYEFSSMVRGLAKPPFDPLIRWLIFLLEFGFTYEDLEWSDLRTWGDISLTHLTTFNPTLDSYQFELKDFNRLLKGYSWFIRAAEDSLERDKEKYYKERFELVSRNIMLKNKKFLQEVLERRRIKASKILHKALIRNHVRTEQQKDEDLEEERKRDYFYARKRDFFDTLQIGHYFEWQAEFDSKRPEAKYFSTKDLELATFDAHLYEDFYNAHGLPVQYSYLIENIVLQSYDQTLQEITHFLKFAAVKIMDTKKNKKKKINYKNLYIKPSFIKRINYLEYKFLKEVVDNKTKEMKTFYQYEYEPLKWDPLMREPMYDFIENNFFQIYEETSDLFTYEDKIKFNDHAQPFAKEYINTFHGNQTLLRFAKLVRNRKIGFKDIKNINWKKKKKKQKMCITIAYINNMRWTWEQWLGYGDMEKENEILNKNIVILNERFRLWNLKRAPIRVKLPIQLNVKETAKSYFLKKSNYSGFMKNYFLLASSVEPMVNQALIWWEYKAFLEKQFNKPISDLVMDIFNAGFFDMKAYEIKKQYGNVFDNFLKNFNIFNKIYFMGMQSYSWDLMRYHELWIGEDDFPWHEYYQLKQMEFMNHDPGVARVVEKVHNLAIERYNPTDYIKFFRKQFKGRLLYNVYSIISMTSFVWFLKILFYHPAEYLSSYYMLCTPLFICILFFFLRRYLLSSIKMREASELYLYKYHSTKVLNKKELTLILEEETRQSEEEILFFFDEERRLKVFGTVAPDLTATRDPTWWRYHTHLKSDNDLYTHKHLVIWSWITFVYMLTEYWHTQKFRYRNDNWLWEYYRFDELTYIFSEEELEDGATNYKERKWYLDSYLRLEGGGNWYSTWYENIYRRYWRKDFKELDYGHDWQKITDVELMMVVDKNTIVNLPCAVADAHWVNFCYRLNAYIPPELKEGRRWAKYALFKKRSLEYKYLRQKMLTNDDVDTNPIVIREIQKYHELYQEGGNFFQKTYYVWKDAFRQHLIQKFFGIHRTRNYNPLRDWFDFQQLMLDVYNYDLTIQKLANLLFDLKVRTQPLLRNDIKRYFSKFEPDVFEYVRPLLTEKKQIFLMKKKAFETGQPLELKALLTISENEKHLNVIYYHFLKYKAERLTGVYNHTFKRVNMWELECKISWFKNYPRSKQHIELTRQIKEGEIYNKKMDDYYDNILKIIGYSEKFEKYIINIIKNISYEQQIEYKANLLLNFWKESKLVVIKKIFYDSTFSEFWDIIIKIITDLIS